MKEERPVTEAAAPPAEVNSPPAAERPLIAAACELYACRVCRTKTGWPHQKWCEMKLVTNPDCGDCRYWSEKKGKCDHPAVRKGGARR